MTRRNDTLVTPKCFINTELKGDVVHTLTVYALSFFPYVLSRAIHSFDGIKTSEL